MVVPDASGICADGSQAQPLPAEETTPVAPEETQQPVEVPTSAPPLVLLDCGDGNSPDASGVCADGSEPQPANATVHSTNEQLSCNDGSLPDASGVCADGLAPAHSCFVRYVNECLKLV